MRIAIYARASESDEVYAHGQSYRLQKYAEQMGWEIVRTYLDSGISGTVDPLERPGFSQLVRDVAGANRPYDAVLVTSWDRVARDAARAFVIAELLHHRFGVTFQAAEESPSDQMLSGIIRNTVAVTVDALDAIQRLIDK